MVAQITYAPAFLPPLHPLFSVREDKSMDVPSYAHAQLTPKWYILARGKIRVLLSQSNIFKPICFPTTIFNELIWDDLGAT